MKWDHLSPTVLYTMSGIFGVLVLASLIVWGMRKALPNANFTELQQRIRSWWIMAIIFTLALFLSRTISLFFFALVSFLALKEYLSMIPTRRADRRVLFWAYLTIPLQYYWVSREWYEMFIIFIPVYAFLFLPMRMVMIGETEGFLRAVGTLHWGLMMTVFSISHVAYLLTLPSPSGTEVQGAGLVLFLVILTQFNDVSQYIWGRSLGKRKVLPKISPGKTWGGLLGGVATTVVLALVVAPYLTPLGNRPLTLGETGVLGWVSHHWEAMAAGVIIGLGGFLGDVTISALKRDLKIKDSGTMLAGHGGILDRIDSLTYTAPLFFHFVFYLYY